MKRILVTLVLISMVLHCTCRLGLLDQIYQQRHKIAVAFGILDSAPIASCGSHYDAHPALQIQTADDQPAQPSAFIQVQEINLFLSFHDTTLPANAYLIINTNYSVNRADLPPRHLPAIFHPPAIV
jgi:hypothetical protein